MLTGPSQRLIEPSAAAKHYKIACYTADNCSNSSLTSERPEQFELPKLKNPDRLFNTLALAANRVSLVTTAPRKN